MSELIAKTADSKVSKNDRFDPDNLLLDISLGDRPSGLKNLLAGLFNFCARKECVVIAQPYKNGA
jgi:hypothetical protein